MTDTSPFDLDAYFRRIGYGGAATPTLETLRAIHALHPAAIPFENLDPLLERPVSLDLAALQAKLVGARRGGYCFEQNGLLKAALEAVGFPVVGLIARVRWMAPQDAPPAARTHMVLRVEADGETWFADVGFGGHLAMAPLRYAPGEAQATAAGVLRLEEGQQGLTLQTRLPDGWRDCYCFTLEEAYPADYELGNWFTSTHPASRFRNALLAERLTPETRTSLFNQKLTLRHADGPVEVRMLQDAAELAETLRTAFGVEPPTDAAAVWARLPPPPAS
jgi:N-hydroxyarylamine O-acetyltransferase